MTRHSKDASEDRRISDKGPADDRPTPPALVSVRDRSVFVQRLLSLLPLV